MKRLRIGWIFVAALLAAASADAQQVIFVVRHAERADSGGATPPAGMMANDPPLSAAGEQRAAKLASTLASAGIKQIFVTEYQRTAQTASALASKLSLTPVVVSARTPDALIEQARQVEGAVLVVGHSNTVPDVLNRFGVTDAVTLADGDYDNLFVVFRNAAGKATLVKLKY